MRRWILAHACHHVLWRTWVQLQELRFSISCLQSVDDLIMVLGASPSELVPVPSWHYDEGQGLQTNIPLKEALTKCYDIRYVVRPSQ